MKRHARFAWSLCAAVALASVNALAVAADETDDPERAEVLRQCPGVAEFTHTQERNTPAMVEAQAPSLPALRDELLAMEKADQDVRNGASAAIDVDGKNLVRIREIIAGYGFPTADLVGADGVAAAWLLVQHADDVALQEQVLETISPPHAMPQGIDGQKIALLTDRVLLRQEKSQRYGSQLRMGENGLEPLPIEDEANVDARRAQMGMMPLADYLCMVRVMSAG